MTRAVAWRRGAPIAFIRESHALEPVGPHGGGGGGDLTGLRLWDAAPALISYLDRHRARLLRGRHALELGAGTGAVGIAAAALGARSVLLTDSDREASLATASGWRAESTLAHVRGSVQLNPPSVARRVAVAELDWGDEAHIARVGRRFDLVVASDTLYYPRRTYERLARTFGALTSAGGTALLSYKVRHGHEPGFARLLVERGFELLHEEEAGDAASLRLVELGARARARANDA